MTNTDIDGSGVTDIIYLKGDGVYIYLNESGNRWADAEKLKSFPHIDNLSSVIAVDLLGNGTACLVWSSPLPGHAHKPMRYIDLMGGQKPHLLVKTVNNLGAETHVHYAPSTKFYLADKLAEKPWITKIPFPVHVVERVETFDHISRNRFVTRYAYHHGYFDGIEREFRGFGMVEQWDTEEYAALTQSQDFPTGDNIEESSHVPPVRTKTWFHTGIYVGRDHISDFFAGLIDTHDQGEYYREPGLDDTRARELLLDDTVLPEEGLTVDEEREACRALKGSMVRQEVYALDGTDKEPHPYTVTEQNFTIRCLQPSEDNRHGVFFTHPREAINYHYERNSTDPRISHALTLEVDNFGNVLRSLAIGYPRAKVPGRQPEQNQTHLTLTLNRFTNHDDHADWYRVGLPVEARTYEVVKPPTASTRFTWMNLSDLVTAMVPLDQYEPPAVKTIPYEQWDWRKQWNPQTEPGGLINDVVMNTRLRLIEHVRTRYRKNDLTNLLPLGDAESLALPGESYKLAYTPELAKQIYVDSGKVSQADLDSILTSEGRYVHSEGDNNWWTPSGRVYYSPNSGDDPVQEMNYARQHFFLPHRYRDPFYIDNAWRTESFVNYDKYDLLMQETRDAIGNRITVGERDQDPLQPLVRQGNDYRVLQPELMMDPNRNCTEVRFDALGLVVGTAVMGKPEDNPVKGDRLDVSFKADLTDAEINAFYNANDPHTLAPNLLKDATTRIIYDLHCFHRTRQANPQDPGKWQPTFAATLARETHVSDPLPTDGLKIQISFSYSDGFGREIQKKIQAEQGTVPKRDAAGKIIVGPDGQPEMTANSVFPRWVGSGWTVFNNKGKPVRQYEPFFTDTHCFEFDVRIGVSPVLFYDPVERVIATLHPNHTYEKVVFDPWQQTTYDVNDTAAVSASGAQTGDPRTDPDIAGYTHEYFKTQPAAWETWYAQRQGGGIEPQEQAAANKAAAHADTPATAYFDTLGRPFLTLEHNRFERNRAVIDDKYPTRVELDIEGNQREVIDAKDRVVMRYDYDMLGNVIHQASMEAGARWKLNDITGNALHAWDDRGHHFWSEYDQLLRPMHQYVRGSDSEQSDPRTLTTDILVQKIEYGESQTNAAELNLRTQVFKSYDGAGVVTNIEINPETGRQEAYDFKGNLLRSSRQLTVDYKNIPNWSEQVALETDSDGQAKRYTSSISYDALNRPVESIAPDNSITRPVYNEANLLERVNVNLRGSGTVMPFVTNIDYDAKGQRTLIEYGNRVITNYEYDPLTFRLTCLHTTRPSHLNGLAAQLFKNNGAVQNLYYTYDPAGNITRIADEALPVINHGNQEVEPTGRYTYDALYRLIEARGREHIGQSAFQLNSPNGNCRDYPFAGFGARSNDPKAVQNYTEWYEYDAVGNFLSFFHQANGGSWQRDYAYDELSLLAEPGEDVFSNRLSRTTLHPNGAQPIVETYDYDAHGNMIQMPHLPLMQWGFKDQLSASSRQVRNDGGTPEITYYVYDAAGQRIRKVTERQAAEGETPTRMKERIYLGGFEIYREYDGSGAACTKERETLHIVDDQQRIALVETKTLDAGNAGELNIPVIRYQLGNHLGSASLELDRDGAVISCEEYHPYGTTSYQAGRSASEISLKRYRYTGMERDEETGFNYHGARYYAVWLGRWAQCDPVGMVDNLNLYVYVQNNPSILLDPEGSQTSMAAEKPTQTEEQELMSISKEHEAITSEQPSMASMLPPQQYQAARKVGYRRTPSYTASKIEEGHVLTEADMPKAWPDKGPQPGDVLIEQRGHQTLLTKEQWEAVNTCSAMYGVELDVDRVSVYEYEAERDPDLDLQAQRAGRHVLREYNEYKIRTVLTEETGIDFLSVQTSGQIYRREMPLSGRVNVGGGRESVIWLGNNPEVWPQGTYTNLQPFVRATGGPPRGTVPNVIEARAEEMGWILGPGSVRQMVGNNLPRSIEPEIFALGAYRAMSKGGKFQLHFWADKAYEKRVARGFSWAGFRRVNILRLQSGGSFIRGRK